MNFAGRIPNKPRARLLGYVLSLSLLFWLMAFLSFLGSGCGTFRTVRPPALQGGAASFDGGQQNSGLVGWHTNASGETFVIITPHMRERYNAMIEIYGARFVPPIKQDAGITEIEQDRKSTRLNSSHIQKSRMPSSA